MDSKRPENYMPERYCKIAQLFENFLFCILVVTLTNGVVLRGKSFGYTETFSEPDNLDADTHLVGDLRNLEFIHIPEGMSFEEKYRHYGIQMDDYESFIWEGGSIDFEPYYEPEKIVMDCPGSELHGQVIWDLKENYYMKIDRKNNVFIGKEKIR